MTNNNADGNSMKCTNSVKGVLSLHGYLKGTLTPTKQLIGKIQSVGNSNKFDLATDQDIDDLFL